MTQIPVRCHQTIFDTNMLKSFQSWKAYSDGAVSENPCCGRQEWAYNQTLIFLRRRNNKIISVALTYHSRVAEVQLLPESQLFALQSVGELKAVLSTYRETHLSLELTSDVDRDKLQQSISFLGRPAATHTAWR